MALSGFGYGKLVSALELQKMSRRKGLCYQIILRTVTIKVSLHGVSCQLGDVGRTQSPVLLVFKNVAL